MPPLGSPRNDTRSGCVEACRRERCRPDFALTTRTRRPCSSCAGGWTACPWPSSSPPPASRCSPHALVERLGNRLDLLKGGARDAPERQRTLRDTISWSYRTALGDEQRLLALLAVFSGATLEAVEAVAGRMPELDAIDVLEGSGRWLARAWSVRSRRGRRAAAVDAGDDPRLRDRTARRRRGGETRLTGARRVLRRLDPAPLREGHRRRRRSCCGADGRRHREPQRGVALLGGRGELQGARQAHRRLVAAQQRAWLVPRDHEADHRSPRSVVVDAVEPGRACAADPAADELGPRPDGIRGLHGPRPNERSSVPWSCARRRASSRSCSRCCVGSHRSTSIEPSSRRPGRIGEQLLALGERFDDARAGSRDTCSSARAKGCSLASIRASNTSNWRSRRTTRAAYGRAFRCRQRPRGGVQCRRRDAAVDAGVSRPSTRPRRKPWTSRTTAPSAEPRLRELPHRPDPRVAP